MGYLTSSFGTADKIMRKNVPTMSAVEILILLIALDGADVVERDDKRPQ